MSDLKKTYQTDIKPKLKEKLALKNVMMVPKLSKITINVGVKEAIADKNVMEKLTSQIGLIVGQKPAVKKAKKAIAGFKLREGDPVGVSVTLRGKRMYDFWEKLVTIVLPRVRDFRGVSPKSFDGQGNYSLGFAEQIVFPEIEYDEIDKIRGLQVTITTTARNDDEAKTLLEMLGIPFSK